MKKDDDGWTSSIKWNLIIVDKKGCSLMKFIHCDVGDDVNDGGASQYYCPWQKHLNKFEELNFKNPKTLLKHCNQCFIMYPCLKMIFSWNCFWKLLIYNSIH